MPSDAAQRARYEASAPDLLAALDGQEMRRDAAGACVKFEDGWCGIERAHGSDFLSDSCHFYPRRFIRTVREREEAQRDGSSLSLSEGEGWGEGEFSRAPHKQPLSQSATLSCPETARLFITTPHPLVWVEKDTPERLPKRIAAPFANAQEQALHEECIALAQNRSQRVEEGVAALIMRAYAWDAVIDGGVRGGPACLARKRISLRAKRAEPPEKKTTDPIALTYALTLLALLGDMPPRPRLLAIIAQMESALGITIDRATRAIATSPDTQARLALLAQRMEQQRYDWLHDWLALQLQAVAFPYGARTKVNPRDRITLIAVRFAMLRLALICHDAPDVATQADILYSLARLTDHQADHSTALQLARDAGWGSEARLLGLVQP